MTIGREHELHRLRARRNRSLGLVLGAFAALVFAITMAKLADGQLLEAFDHSFRASETVPVK